MKLLIETEWIFFVHHGLLLLQKEGPKIPQKNTRMCPICRQCSGVHVPLLSQQKGDHTVDFMSTRTGLLALSKEALPTLRPRMYDAGAHAKVRHLALF